MFSRYLKHFKRVLPLAFAATYTLFNRQPLQLASVLYEDQPKMKFISDIGEYIENEQQNLKQQKILILCELKGEDFIDQQLVTLAQAFLSEAENNHIDKDFQFVFLKPVQTTEEQHQCFFILYTGTGEKVISLEPYVNFNKKKPYIKVSSKPLMKRLIETVKGPKEVSLRNIAQQFQLINSTNNYYALVAVPQEGSDRINEQMSKYLSKHEIKSKSCSKFIVKDQQSKTILGLSSKGPGLYLISTVNPNLHLQQTQKESVFKIGEKSLVVLDAKQQIENKFTFPPIQTEKAPQTIVLNVYINKNHNTGQIQQKILSQLSKSQYKHLPKAVYYTSDVQHASLALQMNEYSKVALTAFDPKKPLESSKVKQLLGNTYQWAYPIQSTSQISSEAIQKWIEQSTGPQKMQHQNFKTQKASSGWSVPITGLEYKQKRDQPNDKVIYHYSQHCHGCKKFGPKFEELARQNIHSSKLKFYRINNDYNKAEGVRNFNTTPVFAYYKEHCNAPFIYKMPIFTDQLFSSFLDITGSLKLMENNTLNKAISDRKQAEPLVKQLLSNFQ